MHRTISGPPWPLRAKGPAEKQETRAHRSPHLGEKCAAGGQEGGQEYAAAGPWVDF